ncbi:MAG: serine hydrolase domain-containing protein [Burkholderiales bacterium]|nr:serine hydrolase domain-containing protein [Burkholderiales bacterium]
MLLNSSRSFNLFASALPLLLAACSAMPDVPTTARALDASRFPAIDAAIMSYIDRQQMPGAAFLISRGGETYAKGYGRQTFAADARAIDTDTIFDAASLTKVVVTATAVQLLIEDGKLDMEAPLNLYLPECAGPARDAITLRHLLTHTSGLNSGLPARPAWRGAHSALKLACTEVPTHPPGTFFRYSDINFILLGLIVERASGEPLDRFADRRIFAPLGMTRSTYEALRRFNASEIAPTQRTAASVDGSLHWDVPREAELRGVVHDPTARFMGGVAGHAGLFTTVNDLGRFARMMVDGGVLDGKRFLSPASIARLTTVQSADAAHWRRTAGWDVETPYSRPRGTLFPVGSYGHTGFTGCLLWIDPWSKTTFTLLSNRVYPNDKGAILSLYTELGTLAAQAAAGFDFSKVDGALVPRQAPKATEGS